MAGPHKRIPIEKLRPGMFVEDVFNQNSTLLFSADTLISDFHQIDILQRQGVCSLYINIQKGIDAEGVESLEINSEKKNGSFVIFPREQIIKVTDFLNRTVETVKDIMSAAKTGRMFSTAAVTRVVEDMVDDVLENMDIYAALCNLKSYSLPLYVHSINVTVIGTGLSNALGYPKDRIVEAGIGLLLHDIGKVKIPETILRKGGMYTRQEIEFIKRHPQYGIEIVERRGFNIPKIAKTIISQHHERYNGSGYPNGIKTEKIDQMSLVCAIADVYDNLTTEGLYRKACLPQEALALIFQGSDEEYPRKLVEHFTKLLGIYPVGSFVKLESGEMGVVTRINRQSLLFPEVLILFDASGIRVTEPQIRNLGLANGQMPQKSSRIECSLDPKPFCINPITYIFPSELSVA